MTTDKGKNYVFEMYVNPGMSITVEKNNGHEFVNKVKFVLPTSPVRKETQLFYFDEGNFIII